MAKKILSARPVKQPRDAALSFRISASLRDALERAASNDDRSVSAYVTRLIERHLREGGFLPGEK
jgi:hypothetical protein